MNLLLPYSHEAALGQLPVSYRINGVTLLLYPLTLRSALEMDQWLRQEYLRQYEGRIVVLPESERNEFAATMLETTAKMTFQYGPGYQFFITNFDAMVRLVRYLCRDKVKERKIRNVVFFGGLTEKAIQAVTEMRLAVHRPIPPAPKLNIPSKQPKYETTQEEGEARIFKMLADKYGWTYRQVLDLTDYQVFWYTYMFPEEREHAEELHDIAHRDDQSTNGGTGNHSVPNSMYFESPEKWEAYKAEHGI